MPVSAALVDGLRPPGGWVAVSYAEMIDRP
jgi:hypothetical protein